MTVLTLMMNRGVMQQYLLALCQIEPLGYLTILCFFPGFLLLSLIFRICFLSCEGIEYILLGLNICLNLVEEFLFFGLSLCDLLLRIFDAIKVSKDVALLCGLHFQGFAMLGKGRRWMLFSPGSEGLRQVPILAMKSKRNGLHPTHTYFPYFPY